MPEGTPENMHLNLVGCSEMPTGRARSSLARVFAVALPVLTAFVALVYGHFRSAQDNQVEIAAMVAFDDFPVALRTIFQAQNSTGYDGVNAAPIRLTRDLGNYGIARDLPWGSPWRVSAVGKSGDVDVVFPCDGTVFPKRCASELVAALVRMAVDHGPGASAELGPGNTVFIHYGHAAYGLPQVSNGATVRVATSR